MDMSRRISPTWITEDKSPGKGEAKERKGGSMYQYVLWAGPVGLIHSHISCPPHPCDVHSFDGYSVSSTGRPSMGKSVILNKC